MTTEMQGGPSRRSFLAAMTAAGVVAGGGLGLVVASAPMASAATDADVTWRITSEPGNGTESAMATYAATLRGIREAISSHAVRPEGGLVVNVTDANGANQYITLDLHAENRPAMIRVFMRRSDNYVMGFRQGTERADGTVDWNSFFHLESTVTLPGAIRGDGGNTNLRYEGRANYSDLPDRTRMEITPQSLHAAVMNLWDSGRFIGDSAAHRSLLQIIVAFAEGARFRNQAAATATAFRYGRPYILTDAHMTQHNNWSFLSNALLGAVVAGAVVLAAPIAIVGLETITTAVGLAALIMLAHHSGRNTEGRGLLEGSTKLVAADGMGDYWTVQEAIDAAPAGGSHTILIDKGLYHEVINVPSSKSWLTIEGVAGNRADVLIYNTRCHGMINPATGAKWGTQGSAVATFSAPNLTVKNLTIQNTFDRNAHPEINQYETQAVAVAAMGDRQTYFNVSIMSHQDTLLCKGATPTTQARQYFYKCFIRGDVDFIFGNATAVIDRSDIQMLEWVGGTILAPNTDYRKKYGILVTDSWISANAPVGSMHLGRPWHNVPEAHPQAVVRNTVVAAAVKETQPWTNMTPDYPWSWARFKEYKNSGLGAGVGANAPKLTDTEAGDYTARKYLAGTDGWNPVR